MKTRNIVRAINSVKTAKEKLEKMNRTYPERYKDKLEDVGKAVTAKWYASYDRLFYRPIESLFDAFRVNLDGTDYSVEFDSSFWIPAGTMMIIYSRILSYEAYKQ